MGNYGTDASLQVPVSLEFDVDLDDDGVSYFVANVYIADTDDSQEIRVETEEVVESLSDFYGDPEGYQHLYIVAHELSRVAEQLREKAGLIEDSITAVGDLFDLDYDD
jgi:hypothetical protein